ncbi:5'-3' exonuclease PLD3-like isoform X1 [Hydractinia symbiolongicarpus]|uniref:5'-3' exonuclease PLD3-like isoform X1 n=2 Tax=Hydractinia symbiolongicarpus TaxID=13093 RepID=UPI00254ABEE4|nr:5'-3' exonuclease PLD3-like isoform X1 [Hydractinia symbiolongicarpus]
MDTHTGEKVHLKSNGTFNNVMSTPTKHTLDTPSHNQPEDVTIQDTLTQNVMKKRMRRKRNKWTLIVTFLSLVLIIIFITIAYLISKGLLESDKKDKNAGVKSCDSTAKCNVSIIETRPSVLKYPSGSPKHVETSKFWTSLIDRAESTIDILSFYWTMNGTDVEGGPYPQAQVGEDILTALQNAALKGIKIRIVQTYPSSSYPQNDTQQLAKYENIDVRSLNMERLMNAGIVHTKVWITDKKHMYVGSANLDWRSLTEVKELGAALTDCACAGEDLQKIFEVNWQLAVDDSKIPPIWPIQYRTEYGKDSPMTIQVADSSPASTYFSTSPPPFCAGQRTTDIDAILDVIKKAQSYIHIAVMDYYAAIIYTYPKKYWPVIDDALREAVYTRGINVKILTSHWSHTNKQQFAFLQSLVELGKMEYIKGSLQVKMFSMPDTSIPFARVNHNKYMVTDNAAFISTSNWSGDYFISTGGVSIVVNQTASTNAGVTATVQEQLEAVFERDWSSQYAHEMAFFNNTKTQ